MTEVTIETIWFNSEGLQCCADIYHPANKPTRPGPALIGAQGFSGVKEIGRDMAIFFAENGYLTLVLDFRSFGASEGSPRGELFPLRQVEDIRNAISYLETRDDVDAKRIALWGTSFAGGVVIHTAAVDRRIAAVISQIPVIDGRRWHQALRTTVQWEALLDALEEDRRARFRGEQSRRIPVTGMGDDLVAMPADKEIIELLDEFGRIHDSWSPTITLESVEKIIEYSPEDMIERIAPRPLLMVTVSGYDISHPAAEILRVFERARQPKEVLILPYTQLGLYFGDGLQKALTHQLDFLHRHLGPVERNG